MKFKINTKENLSILCPEEAVFNANLAGELGEILKSHQQDIPPDTVIDLGAVQEMQAAATPVLLDLQESIIEGGHSCVYAGWPQGAKRPDHLSYAPTVAEAIDIVMMEILERELMDEEQNDEKMANDED